MKSSYCVPTNFQEKYINEIITLNQTHQSKVVELYGTTPTSFVGHVREPISVPKINKKELITHVEYLHKHELKFNLTANTIFLDNKESTEKGKKKLDDFFKEIIASKIDSVTLANPYLIKFANQNYPALKIKSSCGIEATTVENIKKLDSLGLETIVLNRKLNREFYILAQLDKRLLNKLELVVNSKCNHECLFSTNHALLSGKSSQTEKKLGNFTYPYYSILCAAETMASPEEFIKSPWIRPEDIKEYNKIGIYNFKLDGRGKNEFNLLKVIDAYLEGNYAGNLLDLIGHQKLKQIDLKIDNKKLNGFLEFFKNKPPCTITNCSKCTYCSKIAQRAISFNEAKRKTELKKLNLITACLTSNKFNPNYAHDHAFWKKIMQSSESAGPFQLVENYSTRAE